MSPSGVVLTEYISFPPFFNPIALLTGRVFDGTSDGETLNGPFGLFTGPEIRPFGPGDEPPSDASETGSASSSGSSGNSSGPSSDASATSSETSPGSPGAPGAGSKLASLFGTGSRLSSTDTGLGGGQTSGREDTTVVSLVRAFGRPSRTPQEEMDAEASWRSAFHESAITAMRRAAEAAAPDSFSRETPESRVRALYRLIVQIEQRNPAQRSAVENGMAEMVASLLPSLGLGTASGRLGDVPEDAAVAALLPLLAARDGWSLR